MASRTPEIIAASRRFPAVSRDDRSDSSGETMAAYLRYDRLEPVRIMEATRTHSDLDLNSHRLEVSRTYPDREMFPEGLPALPLPGFSDPPAGPSSDT